MTDDRATGIPSSFVQGQGFPSTDEPTIEEGDPEPYPYDVMEPHPVEHSFVTPPEPEPPTTREELEEAVPQYVKRVLTEYDLELEYDRLLIEVDGRFKRALGKCGSDGYHRAHIRVSSKHYVERGHSWEQCKDTIRHELVHAWQLRWLGYSSHGPTFRKKAEELDCTRLYRYDGDDEPKYIGHCQECGAYLKRYRACQTTRNPGARCGVCGASGYGEYENDSVWNIYRNTDWHRVMP